MVTIRDAREADIPRVLELYTQLAMNPGELDMLKSELEFSRDVFRKMEALPGYHLLVAEEAGEVVGTTVVAVLPGLAHGISSWAVVEFVVVEETLRSRGIGQALMERAAEIAHDARCYKIMLGSNKKRPDAHRFTAA